MPLHALFLMPLVAVFAGAWSAWHDAAEVAAA
jgi:hypothetical protein